MTFKIRSESGPDPNLGHLNSQCTGSLCGLTRRFPHERGEKRVGVRHITFTEEG